VSGLSGKTVVSAVLRLYAVDPSETGGRLHRVSSTSWSETSIRWSNQPSYSSAVIGTIGNVVANNWYEIDVKSQITGNGTLSFALESSSTNGADYRAREAGSAWAPRLVIVVE
jgi:acid phosphatase type 7